MSLTNHNAAPVPAPRPAPHPATAPKPAPATAVTPKPTPAPAPVPAPRLVTPTTTSPASAVATVNSRVQRPHAPVPKSVPKPAPAPARASTTSSAPCRTPKPAPRPDPVPAPVPAPVPDTSDFVEITDAEVAEWSQSLPAPTPEHPQPILDWFACICYVVDANGERVLDPGLYLRSTPQRMQCYLDTETAEEKTTSFRSELVSPLGGKYKCWANKGRVTLSGNPTAWVQGHGAFCSQNPQLVALQCLLHVSDILLNDGYRLTVDHISTHHLAHMVDLRTGHDARNALDALRYSSYKGRAKVTDETDGVYYGKTSHLRCIKFYIQASKRFGYGGCDTDPEYMGRFMRPEVVLMDQAIVDHFGAPGPGQFRRFLSSDLQQVFEAEAEAIRIVARNTRIRSFPAGLSYADIGLLLRWQTHALTETREQLRSKRNRILSRCGIDIYLPPSPAPVPQWMTSSSFLAAMADKIVTNFPPPRGVEPDDADNEVGMVVAA